MRGWSSRAQLRPRVIASDNNIVLCKPCGLKSLGFFDTLDPPPKTPGNRPLQAGLLAVPQPRKVQAMPDVFILGAGFSKAIYDSMPTMAEFSREGHRYDGAYII